MITTTATIFVEVVVDGVVAIIIDAQGEMWMRMTLFGLLQQLLLLLRRVRRVDVEHSPISPFDVRETERAPSLELPSFVVVRCSHRQRAAPK